MLEEARHRFGAWAVAKPLIRSMYFFGSRVRGWKRNGEAVTEESDLDVAIELEIDNSDEACGIWIFDSEDWTEELKTLTSWPLDLQLLPWRGTPHVAAYIRQCSKLVYRKMSG